MAAGMRTARKTRKGRRKTAIKGISDFVTPVSTWGSTLPFQVASVVYYQMQRLSEGRRQWPLPTDTHPCWLRVPLGEPTSQEG